MVGFVLLYILLAIAVIVIDWFIAKEFQTVAIDKGYTENKYFWIAFLLGMVGYILIAAMPDKHTRPINTYANNTLSPVSDGLPDL